MTTQPKKRGFAAMDKALVSSIARKGGKAAHSAGTAHEFTSEEARQAGSKGGKATHAKRKGAIPKASNTDSNTDKPTDCADMGGCGGAAACGNFETPTGDPCDPTKSPKATKGGKKALSADDDLQNGDMSSCGGSGCGSAS